MATSDDQQAIASLVRVQTFDTSRLPRRDDLGRELAFDEAVPSAERVIGLFRLVPADTVAQLPAQVLSEVRNAANAFFNILEEILKFSAQQSSAVEIRTQLLQQLKDGYDNWFPRLLPAITFAASVKQDFSRIEMEARAASQAAQDEAAKLSDILKTHEAEASKVLSEVRRVAAEQGVGFQASYFKTEAESHDKSAIDWRFYTILASAGVALLAVASLFLHKIPFFHPENSYEAAQLIVSKVILFATAGYLVVLCARNFLAHTHNGIVNRHRQNALLTFQALVNAAKGDDKKDIILTHASACMFAPQETGFTKQNAECGASVIQLLSRATTSEKASA